MTYYYLFLRLYVFHENSDQGGSRLPNKPLRSDIKFKKFELIRKYFESQTVKFYCEKKRMVYLNTYNS